MAFQRLSGCTEKDLLRNRLHSLDESKLDSEYTRPSLSEWAWRIAKELAEQNPTWRPLPARLIVHLTHDVDRVNPYEPIGLMRRLAVPTRGVNPTIRARLDDLIAWLRNAKHFEATLNTHMKMEREVEAKSTFFFMSGPYGFSLTGSRTGNCLRNKHLKRILESVKRFGHRIGLHGCAYSLQRNGYARQSKALARVAGRDITWHRNHYLVWDPCRSPKALREGGIQVDSTLGFNTRQGFRAGLAWPYELWDMSTNAPSGILEIPMVFMDAAGVIIEEGPTWDELYRVMEEAEALGGEVAVNFHPDYFIGRPEVMDRYAAFLEWLQSRGAKLDSAKPPF